MEKRQGLDRTITFLLRLAAIGMGMYLVCVGYGIIKEKVLDKKQGIWEQMYLTVQEQGIKLYIPGLLSKTEEEKFQEESRLAWLWQQVMRQIPFFLCRNDTVTASVSVESPGMYEKIAGENSRYLQDRIMEENLEAGPAEEGQENTGGYDSQEAQLAESEEVPEEIQKTEPISGTESEEEVSAETAAGGMEAVPNVPLEKFQDYDFVINNYFTVDQTTTINGEQLNAPELVEKDLRLTTPADQPQILIYHTHSQEAFADSREGEAADTIVGVGEYLTTLLRDIYGYQVIHVSDVFDMVDGTLDRSEAYSYAKEKITQVLEENPSIEVVIDLHRDGVSEDKRLVTDVNGKPTAQIMFFNGLSRTTKSGDIESLYNPYIQDNLAFSLQMHLQADKYYPGLARTIYLKGYRYNLHLRPKSLLVECGAQTNTVEEERNAMEPFADILDKVLKGE